MQRGAHACLAVATDQGETEPGDTRDVDPQSVDQKEIANESLGSILKHLNSTFLSEGFLSLKYDDQRVKVKHRLGGVVGAAVWHTST